MPSTNAPLTWPTPAELHTISGCMGGEDGAVDQIDCLKSTLSRLVNLDVAPSIEDVADAIERGSERLTLEHVGAVTSCLAKLRFDLEHALDDVLTMENQRDAMALEVVTSGASNDA